MLQRLLKFFAPQAVPESPLEPLSNVPKDVKVGDRLIVRSNEDEPYFIMRFKQWLPCNRQLLPLMTDEKTGEDRVVFSAVRHYSDELSAKLDAMTPRQQWNFLVPHFPLEE